MLIGALDAPGGVEWNRVEPVLPSERHFVVENKNCTIIRKFH